MGCVIEIEYGKPDKNRRYYAHKEVEDFTNPRSDKFKRVADGETFFIKTLDLTFFEFDRVINSNYAVDNVIITNSETGEYISLNELLNSDTMHHYSDRDIRPAHNVLKMFLAGAFTWRSAFKGE